MPTLFARTLHTPQTTLHDVLLTVADGRLMQLAPGLPQAAGEIDPDNAFAVLTSPFLDIHVHGALGHDFMQADLDGMDTIARFLARRGVAHFLPTTVTTSLDATLAALDRLGRFVEQTPSADAATPLGLHLEGPFLCAAKRGVHPPEHLLPPTVATFERFQQAARGHIRLLTLAPELPGALELIAFATAHGVRVSMGHSNATAAETEAAIQAGARSATHTFNAMHTLDHREPGIAGAVLDSPEVFSEAILDGVHLHPIVARLWFRMKGPERAILVTDGMSATGMPEGTYKLGDLVVEVRDGVCRSGGALAGSVLTMERAVTNLQATTGASLDTAVRCASRNPATMLGLEDRLALAPGSPAHFNIYDDQGHRLGTLLNGQRLPL